MSKPVKIPVRSADSKIEALLKELQHELFIYTSRMEKKLSQPIVINLVMEKFYPTLEEKNVTNKEMPEIRYYIGNEDIDGSSEPI